MSVGRPPVVLEMVDSPFGRGPSAEVNKFSLRPLGDYLRATQSTASLSGDPEPTLFSTGDLPVFCASGVDVDVLRWVHWTVRHSAAMTTDPARVFRMVQEPEAGVGQIPEGEAALRDYVARMWRWAIAPAPVAAGEFSDGDYSEWFAQ